MVCGKAMCYIVLLIRQYILCQRITCLGGLCLDLANWHNVLSQKYM
jgi:hypothetical protein